MNATQVVEGFVLLLPIIGFFIIAYLVANYLLDRMYLKNQKQFQEAIQELEDD